MNGCKQCPAFAKCTIPPDSYRGSRCAALRSTYGLESDPEIITNADRIRAMSDEELAKNNIRYDYDEESYENCALWYETSDGSTFYDEESAVEYELD